VPCSWSTDSKMWFCEENTRTSAVLCSRRRLRSLSTLNPCHSLAAMLLVVLVIVTCFWCPSSLGQTPASANVQIGHDSWTFKEGAPAEVTCLAQTNDGFLWLGGPSGLFRFDGTRFEPFSSPFGDRLLSTNLYSLFAPARGGVLMIYGNMHLTVRLEWLRRNARVRGPAAMGWLPKRDANSY
jgi:hypothetical protein